MEEFAREKIGAWRHIDHWLILGLLPTGRSSPSAPSGGVVGLRWSSRRKSSPKFFPDIQSSLMATKDSRDEGELAKVGYDH